jgi:hypothetical protein
MNPITPTKENLIEAVESIGLDESNLRFDYSGKGMMGRECLGLEGGISDLINFTIELTARAAFDGNIEAVAWMGNVRSDSMGYSTIWYWPSLNVEGSVA